MKRNAALLWIVLTGSGCVSREVAVEIPFVATIGRALFSCGENGADFAPSDLRLYVHEVAFLDSAGHATPVNLNDDGVWQNQGVALLDFENGANHCADGTTGTHTTLTGRVRGGDYRGLQFVVGVPFARNHGDAATADAPLNLGRMHWGWQGGYKFLRFEATGTQSAFRFHLGSTGCEGTIGNIARCRRPNRAAIRLDGFLPDRSAIDIDLSTLMRGDAQRHSVVSCMSEPDEEACAIPFAAIGLDPASGTPAGGQTLFKVIARSAAAS